MIDAVPMLFCGIRMETDGQRKTVSARPCINCLRIGEECFLSVQEWGDGDKRFACECCGHDFIEKA